MRTHARHRLDPAAVLPAVGTSVMMVVAATAGYDEPPADPAGTVARPARIAA